MKTADDPSATLSARDRRALLAERLRSAPARNSHCPLSFAQQRLWFLEQLAPNTALYNVPTLARVTGPLNVPALDRALQAVIARHEVLRTHFSAAGGAPVQIVAAAADFKSRWIDLSTLADGTSRQKEAQRLIREEVERPFDLAGREPLLRAMVLRLGAGEHLLVLNLHHIVSDEWSLRILFRELSVLYEASLLDRPAVLTELPIQYADYAVWQREWLRGETLDRQIRFWKKQLAAHPPVTELPTDHPRKSEPTFRGGRERRVLAPEVADGIKKLAEQKSATPFMALLAAFTALVHRCTGQLDIIVGSPIAGRNRLETEGLIGFFVNTLLLRSDLSGNPTFEELLERVRATTLAAYAHQDLPFEKLIEELRPDRSLNHLPFSRLMFVTQNGGADTISLAGLDVELMDVDTGTSKFDATFVIRQTPQGLIAEVEYNADLFEADTIARLLGHFDTLLTGAVKEPARRLSELPLLSAQEQRQLVQAWNETATDYPRNRCIHELFEAQAKLRPDALAVDFGGRSLTYRELDERADQLAGHLQQFKVGPDLPVAICVERSVDLIVGLLGILKAGGAYVPLDPATPKDRLAFMLADTRSAVLLTQRPLLGQLPQRSATVICLDTDWQAIEKTGRSRTPSGVKPENLAYVMYTSGSTGQPKGVMVPHRAVNRLVLHTNYIEFDPTDRIAQVANASFDAMTFEVWGALLNGGQLIGISSDVALSARDFAAELRQRGITAMFLTAALFNHVAGEAPGAFETLRTVIAGGEALDPKWVRAVLRNRPPMRLVNGYGPTENTTFTCCGLIEALADDATNVPIGRPISNTQVYILDTHRHPVPVGVPGELYCGGDGLARGYWNRPELTAEKFVANPFSSDPANDLLYRTGDWVRFLPDGSIEFIGRIDHQVKIRGFRIELGEVEAVLARCPGVRECVVTAIGKDAGQKRLAAYFIAGEGSNPQTGELRNFLKENLPDYMIPAAFVRMDEWPLTPTGKVDRRALPEPDRARPSLEGKYASPRDAVELDLTKIWEEVLGVKGIGIEDGFFELGGHSMLAVKLIARIEKTFGKKLRLAAIFQAPTIEELAVIIREETRETSPTNGTSLVELKSEGSGPPLFFVHGAGGGMFWGYVNLARRLGSNRRVYGFSSRGLDGRAEIGSIEGMAAQYVADLRRVQPTGPYHLSGYCFGGNVAYEMARQLQIDGEQVALLALLNCAPPNSNYTRIRWTPAWYLRFVRNLVYWAGYVKQWTPSQRRGFVLWKWNRLKHRLNRDKGVAPKPSVPIEAESLVDLSAFPAEQHALWRAHIRALMNFHPQTYPGRVHLFRSPGHPLFCSFAPDYGWGELAQGGVTVVVVPGAHEKILEEPWVEVVAAELKRLLDAPSENSERQAAEFVREGLKPIEDSSRRPTASCAQMMNAGASGKTVGT